MDKTSVQMLSYRRLLLLPRLRLRLHRLVVGPSLVLKAGLPHSLLLQARNHETDCQEESKELVTRMLLHLRHLMLLMVVRTIRKTDQLVKEEGLQTPEPESERQIGQNSM